eukprot:CAMPEP_0181329056 /NCGR_PEP_ID=MMETSP1101-20121128/23093_1 /TAXON_ID=46948 /ORGANISM="Rhodomonas abbreviata, Strain Caron Lab Isolate" /LENGTH=222 /DNA_ID=CAMNT_0023438081 /DNA_START=41 /DNA_END=709 /DNA_ORIENTATION=-
MVKVTYWAGRGRAEPLRCILAAAGIRFENNFLQNRAELLELIASKKLAYEQVPLVEIDGLDLVQQQPTAVYIGQKGNLWPDTLKDQYAAGAVYAAAQDARGAIIMLPFSGNKEKVVADTDAPNGLFGRYVPKWEALLESKKFFLGDKASIADVAVFEVLDAYHQAFGEAQLQEKLKAFPRVLGLHEAVLGLGYVREWRDELRPKLFLEPSAYAQVVMATLTP